MPSTYNGMNKLMTRDCQGSVGDHIHPCPYFVEALHAYPRCLWGLAWKKLRRPPGLLRRCQLRKRPSPRQGEDTEAALPVPRCQLPLMRFSDNREVKEHATPTV